MGGEKRILSFGITGEFITQIAMGVVLVLGKRVLRKSWKSWWTV